ncbi:MAG: hypothetical protein AAF566_02130 [Pseudomonadota bacterium]
MPDQPSIAFVLVTDGSFETCRRTTGYLRNQTIASEIELIIVGPSKEEMAVDYDFLTPFHSVQVVEFGPVTITGHASAAGVRVAEAEFVAYAEEHDYPPETLAETALAKLREGYPAVGWALTNANPGLVSWAHLCLQFAPGVYPVPSGEVPRLTGHHAAYRKDMLLDYGDQLPDLMSSENVLQMDLHARGEKLFMCGDVASAHVHVSNPWNLIMLEFYAQRGFAGVRIEVSGWGWPMRLLYALGSPLIPFKRTGIALEALRRDPERSKAMMPQIVPVMFGVAVAGAVGEAIGYLFGGKEASYEKTNKFETDRFAFVAKRDKTPKLAVGADTQGH